MKTIFTITVLLCTAFFYACNKNSSNPPPDSSVDVYVSGNVYVSGDIHGAVYWKNDTLKQLDDGMDAFAIAVSGTDVYVAGSKPSGFARYWKNGIPVDLSSPNSVFSFANDIAVSSGNIYFSGFCYWYILNLSQQIPVAGYWLNDSFVGHPLIPAYTYASGIAVSGSDIYLSGSITFPILDPPNPVPVGYGDPIAVYWKNNTLVELTDFSQKAESNAIAVAGNDVYVAGYVFNASKTIAIATYWKNGTPIPLSDSSANAYATDITISGADVYVSGYKGNGTNNIATYWKNGVPVTLTDGTNDAHANAIAILGSDVYVAGDESYTGNPVAKYWKNGSPLILTDSSSNATATDIVLVQK